jgi:predicted phosphodiesterase
MKIALITDLHANREAVQAVLDHAAGQGAQRHAFLGDLVGYGADPGWVVDRVREHVRQGALVVQGNHDAAVARGATASMRIDARRVVDWTRSQLDASQIDFLASLPISLELGDVLFVHASASQPDTWPYVTDRLDAVRSMTATQRRITFCGHVHEPRLYHLSAVGKAGDFIPVSGEPIRLLGSRRWLAIPGSSGQPRDGDPAASYAIFDEDLAELTCWRVPYDVEAAAARILAAELPPSFATRLVDGR